MSWQPRDPVPTGGDTYLKQTVGTGRFKLSDDSGGLIKLSSLFKNWTERESVTGGTWTERPLT